MTDCLGQFSHLDRVSQTSLLVKTHTDDPAPSRKSVPRSGSGSDHEAALLTGFKVMCPQLTQETD